MIRKATFSLAVFASVLTIQPASASPLSPTSLERAIDEFDQLCVATFPNQKRFEYLIAKSDFGYSKAEDDATWQSPKAVVSHVTEPGQPDQCNFDAALAASDNDREKVAKAIEGSLAKELGLSPVRLVFDNGMKWEWQLSGAMHSVSYYFGANIPAQQLVLTYRVDTKG